MSTRLTIILSAVAVLLTTFAVVAYEQWSSWFPPEPIRPPAQAIIDFLYLKDNEPWTGTDLDEDFYGPCSGHKASVDVANKLHITRQNGHSNLRTYKIEIGGNDITAQINDREWYEIRKAVQYRREWIKFTQLQSVVKILEQP